MTPPTRSLVYVFALLGAALACSDDDEGAGAGKDAGGSHGGDASAKGGTGGRDGSTSTGKSGTGGSGGHSGSAGTGGGGTGGGGEQDAGKPDSGSDAGMPQSNATVCKAPVVASGADHSCPANPAPALALTLVKDGFTVPVFVAQPTENSPLFVVERGGLISLLDPDGSNLREFMTVPNVVAGSGVDAENGLLGLAFHPDFPSDPRFFVYYYGQNPTGGAKDQISAFTLMADDPDKGDPTSEQPLLDYADPEGNHNGGMLAFGPDGCLYIASGDGGGSNDQHGPPGCDANTCPGNGQNLDSELGKLLRLDVDAPATGAPGNLPGAGSPHIWDYGLRNPWRFSFDRMTGDIYIGDVGQGAWEEVDVEAKGDGHKNYGWKIMEGTHCRPGGADPCVMDGLTLPVTEYPHVPSGDDCIVGGYVYRGSVLTGLQGYYLYADNGGSRRIRALSWNGESTCSDPVDISTRDGIALQNDITSFGQDFAGELYVTTSTSVFRIVAKP